jgi:hypothetical protein
VTEIWFTATPLTFLDLAMRAFYLLRFAIKTQMLPRFWPLLRHDYKQSQALRSARPLV